MNSNPPQTPLFLILPCHEIDSSSNFIILANNAHGLKCVRLLSWTSKWEYQVIFNYKQSEGARLLLVKYI